MQAQGAILDLSAILVRVFHRNGTNRMYIAYLYTHMIVGAGKSPDLQSAHWRPSRAHDVSSSLKTGKLRPRRADASVQVQRQKKTDVSAQAVRQEAFSLI